MESIIKLLLNIGAIEININKKFWWASGILSPIYTDNRMLLGYPQVCRKIEQKLVRLIKTKFSQVEQIIGVATAGIPHGAICAWQMQLPFAYARITEKDHGKQKSVDGFLKNNTKIVIVEDSVTTGKSVSKIIQNIKMTYKVHILGIVSIFSYDLESARDSLRALKVPLYSLATRHDLIKVLKQDKKQDKNVVILENFFEGLS